MDSVEVRARVSGYLDKVNFKEGALVKKDDKLFEIDQRPYRAELDRARATVAQIDAHVRRLERDYKRAKNLVTRSAIGQEEYDRYEGDYREAAANLDVAKANRDLAALNVEYARVTAPVSGRVSRYAVTPGNLIQAGDQNGGTLLTTIVSVDPMYAYFDVDERTVLRARQLIRAGKAKSARETEWPVSLGLATEEGFPHLGTINFEDNQVNPKTGTLRAGACSATRTRRSPPAFSPAFVCPSVKPTRPCWSPIAPSTPTRARRSSTSSTRRTRWSPALSGWGRSHDGLREITDGLKPGERVIVNGLQLVRPGITVESKLVDMPTSRGRGHESGVKTQNGPVRVAKTTP